jgi:hypothetical protein
MVTYGAKHAHRCMSDHVCRRATERFDHTGHVCGKVMQRNAFQLYSRGGGPALGECRFLP